MNRRFLFILLFLAILSITPVIQSDLIETRSFGSYSSGRTPSSSKGVLSTPSSTLYLGREVINKPEEDDM
ncbi:hypothetical protein OAK75_06315 [Bacteriovoracales bacterium]|nr:hypothetical protein [Bacteriovoracales bacterium]